MKVRDADDEHVAVRGFLLSDGDFAVEAAMEGVLHGDPDARAGVLNDDADARTTWDPITIAVLLKWVIG